MGQGYKLLLGKQDVCACAFVCVERPQSFTLNELLPFVFSL